MDVVHCAHCQGTYFSHRDGLQICGKCGTIRAVEYMVPSFLEREDYDLKQRAYGPINKWLAIGYAFMIFATATVLLCLVTITVIPVATILSLVSFVCISIGFVKHEPINRGILFLVGISELLFILCLIILWNNR